GAHHVGQCPEFGLRQARRRAQLAHPGAEQRGHGRTGVNSFGQGVTSVPYEPKGKAASPFERRARRPPLCTERDGPLTSRRGVLIVSPWITRTDSPCRQEPQKASDRAPSPRSCPRP